MDWLTLREMRIAGISIATTVIALSFAETGGQGPFNTIRIMLAALSLGLVLFAGKIARHES
jgi:pilus assembly protein Flp/PilA